MAAILQPLAKQARVHHRDGEPTWRLAGSGQSVHPLPSQQESATTIQYQGDGGSDFQYKRRVAGVPATCCVARRLALLPHRVDGRKLLPFLKRNSL
jgi:hypothetical protein